MTNEFSTSRRGILVAGALATSAALSACAGNRAGDETDKLTDPREEVDPGEDLMREHGVLSRVMSIYDDAALRLETGGLDVDPGVISQAAGIVKTFIGEYHEELEEDYLFPRFEKAGMHKDLVAILRVQHAAGRRLTTQIQSLASGVRVVNPNNRRELASAMRRFNRMYRPHAAREDTVLYPAVRKVVSASEYEGLSGEFEKREREVLGGDGFEAIIAKVATLERNVGLFDLSQYTPE